MIPFVRAECLVAQFKFARDFQIQIVALMYQSFDFLIMVHDLVKPEYFPDDDLIWYFVTLRDYYLDYQMRIGKEVLENELLKACRAKKIQDRDIPMFLGTFKKIQEPILHKSYIADEVAKFCRHQAIKAAVLEAPALLENEEWDEIESNITSAVQIGSDAMDVGELYFVDWPERLRRMQAESKETTMPTGITILDTILGGGLKSKQLGLWMAPTSRGKSIAMVHCGKRAVISKKKVAHYTMELSSDEVSARYDSSFSRIPIQELMDHEIDLSNKLSSMGRMWGNSLLIKEYASGQASVSSIRTHLLHLASIGFQPDLILVDYIDLLKPPRHYKEKRDELSAITTDLRGLAGEFVAPLWTATQSQRAAITLETHTEAHVAEDIGKVNISDVAITLNQNEKEAADGIMRLFVAKNRNGPRYMTIPIQTSLERMCFYEPTRTGQLPRSGSKMAKAKKPN